MTENARAALVTGGTGRVGGVIAARLEAEGFALTGLVAASEDDWDRYEGLHWRAMEEWLAEHPDEELRALHEQRRAEYLRSQRSLLGWAIFVGRKA